METNQKKWTPTKKSKHEPPNRLLSGRVAWLNSSSQGLRFRSTTTSAPSTSKPSPRAPSARAREWQRESEWHAGCLEPKKPDALKGKPEENRHNTGNQTRVFERENKTKAGKGVVGESSVQRVGQGKQSLVTDVHVETGLLGGSFLKRPRRTRDGTVERVLPGKGILLVRLQGEHGGCQKVGGKIRNQLESFRRASIFKQPGICDASCTFKNSPLLVAV